MALISSDHCIIIIVVIITHRRVSSKTTSQAEMRLLFKTYFVGIQQYFYNFFFCVMSQCCNGPMLLTLKWAPARQFGYLFLILTSNECTFYLWAYCLLRVSSELRTSERKHFQTTHWTMQNREKYTNASHFLGRIRHKSAPVRVELKGEHVSLQYFGCFGTVEPTVTSDLCYGICRIGQHLSYSNGAV